LISALEYGIGIIHDGLTSSEINTVKRLYENKVIKLLVISQQFCWEVTELKSNIVILMDLERYDGTERRFVEYSIPDVLQMQSLACETIQTQS
jgi:pre-mRNA-splicing helicase BRR2